MEFPSEKYQLHKSRYSPPGESTYGFNNLWIAFAGHHEGYELRPAVKGAPRRELVPEPHNPVDPTAVAVYDEGRRIGYLPAELAAGFHDLVQAHNHRGKAVVVDPSTGAQGVRVPYFNYRIDFYRDSGLPQEIGQFVEDVVANETDILLRRGYRLTDEDISILRRHRNRLPSLTWPEIHPYYQQSWHLYGEVHSDLYVPGALRWEIKLRRDPLEEQRRQIQIRSRMDRDTKIVQHYQSGAELADTAAMFELNVSTVISVLRRANVEEIGTPSKVERRRRDDEILRRYRAGSSQTEIARALGTSQQTVAKSLAAAGIHTGTTSNSEASLQRAEKAVAMARMQKEGASRSEIAVYYNVSVESVKQLLQDGRFYLCPHDFPERLQATLAIEDEGPAADKTTRKLRRDNRILRDLLRRKCLEKLQVSDTRSDRSAGTESGS